MSSELVSLSSEVGVLSGFAWKSSKFQKDPCGLPIVRIQNVGTGGEVGFVYWNDDFNDRFVVTEGELLLTLSGSFRLAEWKGADALLNQRILKLTPSANLDRRFFLNYMQTQLGRIERMGRHALVNNVSVTDIKNLQIPLPPLDEQKRIARILDAADALRAKRRESLAQLDTLLQSTFLDMFGDPVTNPMGWEVRPLGELGTLDRGVSKHRPRNEPSLLGGPYPLIQTGEVAKSEGYITTYTATYSDLGLRQSRLWPAGTLCITIAANIANTGILTFDACFPDSIVGFLSDEEGRAAYVQGLFWFFRAILERKAPQSAQKNINLQILRGLPIPFPPLDLQHHFATIVQSIEQQKTTQRTHLAELDTLFASLQSRAFRGDL